MTRRLLRAVAASCLVAGFVTACSGSDADTSGGTEVASGDAHGTLRFGTNQKLEDWEPLTKANETYVSLVYEGLVALAPDGVTFQPRLAESWTQDNSKIEFTLRQGVTFHDGTPFNAEAVVTNLKRIKDTPSEWQTMMDTVKDITAVDDHHVRITLNRAAPSFLRNAAQRGAVMISPKALADGTWKTQPSGTGPWKFQGDQSVPGFKTVVTYNDKYYAPQEVGPHRIELSYINDPDSLYNSLRSGQMDIVWTNATLAKRAKADGFATGSFPSVMWHLLMLDTDKTFKEPKLRQAICSAINPQDFIDAQLGGEGEVHYQRLRQGEEGYNPDVKGYPYDPAKAKALMAELGNPKVQFSFASFDSQRPVAELFRSQMAQIGIDVKVDLMTFAQFYSTFNSGKYPAAILSDSADTGVYDYYRYRYLKDGAGNPFHTAHPDLDATVEKALDATDREAESAEWRTLVKQIDDQALDCGFFDYTGFWAYDPKKIENVVSTVGNVATFRYREAKVRG
ncbi:ABC transporter substrate-binding protein [Microtetraspora niveoalba]|uniref:ABC transporter substrate-binding protein n=1 Tax=Microtetraspora niveoalba TaxID=46175 RepID=UPI0009FDB8AC|nr:ABC transporter substrate-binding protein [Microtetraspora niveoalba]